MFPNVCLVYLFQDNFLSCQNYFFLMCEADDYIGLDNGIGSIGET